MSYPFQEHHGWMNGKMFILKKDVSNQEGGFIRAGSKVKCVMVSRFGDCGITTDLAAEYGYSFRVDPIDLDSVPGEVYDMTVTIPEFLRSIYKDGPVEQLPLSDLHRITEDFHPCKTCNIGRSKV